MTVKRSIAKLITNTVHTPSTTGGLAPDGAEPQAPLPKECFTMDQRGFDKYKIEWIASFVAVARTGGFSAGAKLLYRAQPRVSTHIAELERTLGVRLFDRTVHPVDLTPEGRALLPHAEAVLAHLSVFRDCTAQSGRSVRGEVRVGMYPSVAAHLYPKLVVAIRAGFPDINIRLHEGTGLSLAKDLADGRLDLAVRPLLPSVKGDQLDYDILWSEPLVAVTLEDHPISFMKSVPIRHLATLPLITIGDDVDEDGRQFEVNLTFARVGLNPRIAFRTNQPATLVSLVRQGLGVGVTNELAIAEARQDGITATPIRDASIDRQVALWRRVSQPASIACTAVRSAISQLPVPAGLVGSRD